MPTERLSHLALAALLAAGCTGDNALGGDSSDGTAEVPDLGRSPDLAPPPPDLADNGSASSVYPAPHPDPPQESTGGGPTLRSPKFVPVFFAGDDMDLAMKVADFASRVGATEYWKTTTGEYGVGPATAAPPVFLKEMAPASIDDGGIQTWLVTKLNSDDPELPAATGNTIYVIHYPAGTTITLPSGGGNATSCQDFGGYHSDTVLDSKHGNLDIAYAVIPRCDSFGALTGLDAVTGTESHEMIEAATDPHPQDNPAYYGVDDDHFYWQFALGGGEAADLCAQFPGVFVQFPELPYTVQRSWSNVSALAGHDPCVPTLPGRVYFNAAPDFKETMTILIQGQSLTLPGVVVPVGQSKTVDLALFSDGDTGGPWTVTVKDFGGGSSSFQYSLDRSQGENGERLHLTIKSVSASQRGRGMFYVVSKLNGKANMWFGEVSQK